MHSSKLTSRHVRVMITHGASIISKQCGTHPDKNIEFFCPACNVPVCVHCKMIGHHSTGEASKHQLVGVNEAYHSVLESSAAADSVTHSRRMAIVSQIANIADRAKMIEANSSVLQIQLEEIYKRALLELKNHTLRKVSYGAK
jgi:hypothetical protein